MENVFRPLVSEVRDFCGAPALFIDGVPQTGLMHWNRIMTPGDVSVFSAAGIHLFSFMGVPPMPDPQGGEASYADGFAPVPILTDDYVDDMISLIESADPKARILLRLRLMTPDWWRNAHPGECVRAYDVSSGRWRNLPWATPASSNWRSIVGRAVGNVIRHVEERWPHRVLGYHPGLGCCAENAYEWGVSIADYSEAQQLAFDRPLPDPERLVSRRLDDVRRLLDPVADAESIAFMKHLSKGMADATCFLAHVVKDELGRLGRTKVCGAFYGYLCLPVNNVDLLSSGHQDHQRVLSCPDIDFICAPVDYGARPAGCAALAQALPGSIAAHGKLYWAEDDTRFHLAHEASDRVSDTPETTKSILLRNFTDSFSHGGATWWMDLFGKGWYRDKSFIPVLESCRKFAEAHFASRRSVAQIAVFAHPEAVAYERAAPIPVSNELVAAELSEVAACGAPYDIFALGDLSILADNGRLGQYRLAIILNAHAVDPDLRALVKAHLQKDGRTVIFLGTPGYVNGANAGADQVRDLTGVGVVEVESREAGFIEAFPHDRRMVFGQARRSSPQLVVADGNASPVGWHVQGAGYARPGQSDGAALAEKAFPDWKSVVCLANALPSDLIRHFAAEAGVHIYSDHGDQVFAGPGWFALAAKMPGEHTLRPRNGGAAFQVRLNRGEFALFEDR